MRALTVFAMCAFFPAIPGLPGLSTVDAEAYLARLRATAPWLFRAGLALGVIAFCAGPILTLGLPLPARWLSRARLDEHTERAATSSIYPFRMLIFTLKMNAGLAWGAAASSRQALGLAPLAPDPVGSWTGAGAP